VYNIGVMLTKGTDAIHYTFPLVYFSLLNLFMLNTFSLIAVNSFAWKPNHYFEKFFWLILIYFKIQPGRRISMKGSLFCLYLVTPKLLPLTYFVLCVSNNWILILRLSLFGLNFMLAFTGGWQQCGSRVDFTVLPED